MSKPGDSVLVGLTSIEECGKCSNAHSPPQAYENIKEQARPKMSLKRKGKTGLARILSNGSDGCQCKRNFPNERKRHTSASQNQANLFENRAKIDPTSPVACIIAQRLQYGVKLCGSASTNAGTWWVVEIIMYEVQAIVIFTLHHAGSRSEQTSSLFPSDGHDG